MHYITKHPGFRSIIALMSGLLKLRITHSDNSMAQTIVQDMNLFTLYTFQIDDDGLFKLHIIAYKMKYNVFTINKIIYYN